jgi:hypothetical protein
MTTREPSDVEMDRVCTILASISTAYPADSAEANAIRDAALAYTVVHRHNALMQAYQRLIASP